MDDRILCNQGRFMSPRLRPTFPSCRAYRSPLPSPRHVWSTPGLQIEIGVLRVRITGQRHHKRQNLSEELRTDMAVG
jgi:hypothetical protein